MSLVNTKSMLAQVTFPSENITVEHGNYQTSMDVKNRVLRLPIWKEMVVPCMILWFSMKLDTTLHTRRWMNESSDKGSGYKSFLNVVEDA